MSVYKGHPGLFFVLGVDITSWSLYLRHMDFFRIESGQGKGPYHSGDYDLVTSDPLRHPTPWTEGLWFWNDEDDYQNFVCGFRSVEQLLTWFTLSDLRGLETSTRNKYYVILFETRMEHARFGWSQAVARKSFLIEKSRKTLSEFIRSVQSHNLTFDYQRAKMEA